MAALRNAGYECAPEESESIGGMVDVWYLNGLRIGRTGAAVKHLDFRNELMAFKADQFRPADRDSLRRTRIVVIGVILVAFGSLAIWGAGILAAYRWAEHVMGSLQGK